MCKKNNNNKSLLSQKEAAEIPTLKKKKENKKQPRKAKHTTLPTPTFFAPHLAGEQKTNIIGPCLAIVPQCYLALEN